MATSATCADATRDDEPRSASRVPRSAVYHRRCPERPLLDRLVPTHLATWWALHDDSTGRSASALTEREFRRYLDCGYLADGQCFRPARADGPRRE